VWKAPGARPLRPFPACHAGAPVALIASRMATKASIRARFAPRVAPLFLGAAALASACLQGARAPEVAPRGTLAPSDGEAAPARPEGPFGVVLAAPKGEGVEAPEITVVWNPAASPSRRPPLAPHSPGSGDAVRSWTPASWPLSGAQPTA